MTMDLGFLWSKILRVRKKGREKKCVSTCIYMCVCERESVCVCVGVSERERERDIILGKNADIGCL